MKKETAPKSRLYFILSLSLTMVIIVEAVLIVNSLRKTEGLVKLPPVKKTFPFVESKKGTIKVLLEKNQSIKPNQNLKAKIVFDSQDEQVAGVDVILTFDPEAISISNTIGNKELFDQIIINTQQQKQGRIKITAYSPNKTLLQEQILASLTLRLLKNQPATLGVEFLGPDAVADSNLVSQKTQKDVLSKVQSLKLTPE